VIGLKSQRFPELAHGVPQVARRGKQNADIVMRWSIRGIEAERRSELRERLLRMVRGGQRQAEVVMRFSASGIAFQHLSESADGVRVLPRAREFYAEVNQWRREFGIQPHGGSILRDRTSVVPL